MSPVRAHRWAFCIAVFVGLCAAAPAIIAPLAIGDAYRGIQFTPLDDEEIYRARIHEILDGHGSVASPFLYEYKSSPTPMPPVNEWLYALPAFLFGLSAVVVASKFLLPATLFFPAYLLLRRITDDELTAIAGGLLTFFSVEFVDYGYMLSLVHGGWPRPLLWTRLVNPVVGAIEVFAFLNFLWLAITRGARFAYIGAGLTLALTVGYYFSFGISAAILGVLFLVYFYRREYDIVRRLALSAALALVFTIPFWYTVFGAIGGSREFAMRNGMFFTHAPVFNKLLSVATILVLAAFLFAWLKEFRGFPLRDPKGNPRNSFQWVFVFALIASGWIAFNEQVLTGREIWHHHFVQYAGPLATVAVTIALYLTVREKFPRLWRWGMIGVIALCLFFGAYSTLHIVPRLETFTRLQTYGPVVDWLNSNAPQDCVVLVYEPEEGLARFIPAYSHCNVYLTTVTFSGISMERALHNFLLQMRLFDVAQGDAEKYLHEHESIVRGTFFEDWNQALMNADPEWLDAKIRDVAAQYREFAKGDLEAQIRAYRVDYIVSEGPLPDSILRRLPHLKERALAGQWYMYE